VTPDGTVSEIHVRVYCTSYEPDSDDSLPPLVYAQDMSSTNGTWLEAAGGDGRRVALGSSPVLISDGDVLYLGLDTKCVFENRKKNATPLAMTPRQQQDIEARRVQDSAWLFMS
jgi:pSer/pThr/pTyr-binding forkhead associated (FHA) protein